MTEALVDKDNPLGLDIEVQTVRGRACPSCGGKIIPSNRAVYQGAGTAGEVFPAWQCERCGYEEMSERPQQTGKAKH
jgi:DNA-directed RNA polymerase subunit RPC12/RpoP